LIIKTIFVLSRSPVQPFHPLIFSQQRNAVFPKTSSAQQPYCITSATYSNAFGIIFLKPNRDVTTADLNPTSERNNWFFYIKKIEYGTFLYGHCWPWYRFSIARPIFKCNQDSIVSALTLLNK
jgi:hypothetical protein